MNTLLLLASIFFGITIPLFGCPLCVDRINDLQEPFFYKKNTEVAHV